MARAAAKRRKPARHHEADHPRHKDSGGQRFEDTLFFNRLRKQAKWVFVFLAIVFGGGFVLFGVGSSNLGGLSDIFSGIRGGGSGQASVKKALKETEKTPKRPQAWRDLATAYESDSDIAGAIRAWTTYTTLRPKDVEGWRNLADDYTTQLSNQTLEAQQAQVDAQSAQQTNFGPPASSPLGQALAAVPDPIAQAAAGSANQRFNVALTARADTASRRLDAYARLAKLEPTDPEDQLLLGGAAADAAGASASVTEAAAEATVAIAAYKKFIELAPDDNQVPYAKQQIKALQARLAAVSQG